MPVLKNQRWELFAQGLAAGKTADEAYEAAGYVPNRGNAARLKPNESIQSRVAELAEAQAKRAGITKEMVLAELGKLGFSNMMDYVSVKDGQAYVDLSKLTREQAAAISEVTVETLGGEKSEDGAPLSIMRTKFKLSDKRGALELLGKHFGLFPTKVEHTGADGGPIKTEGSASELETARRLAFLLERGEREAGTKH
jgi:phage terminase small subunit